MSFLQVWFIFFYFWFNGFFLPLPINNKDKTKCEKDHSLFQLSQTFIKKFTVAEIIQNFASWTKNLDNFAKCSVNKQITNINSFNNFA